MIGKCNRGNKDRLQVLTTAGILLHIMTPQALRSLSGSPSGWDGELILVADPNVIKPTTKSEHNQLTRSGYSTCK